MLEGTMRTLRLGAMTLIGDLIFKLSPDLEWPESKDGETSWNIVPSKKYKDGETSSDIKKAAEPKNGDTDEDTTEDRYKNRNIIDVNHPFSVYLKKLKRVSWAVDIDIGASNVNGPDTVGPGRLVHPSYIRCFRIRKSDFTPIRPMSQTDNRLENVVVIMMCVGPAMTGQCEWMVDVMAIRMTDPQADELEKEEIFFGESGVYALDTMPNLRELVHHGWLTGADIVGGIDYTEPSEPEAALVTLEETNKGEWLMVQRIKDDGNADGDKIISRRMCIICCDVIEPGSKIRMPECEHTAHIGCANRVSTAIILVFFFSFFLS